MTAVSNHDDADKTRVMPRVESGGAPPRGPERRPRDETKRTWLFVALGVLGGVLAGALIAWLFVNTAGKPSVASTTPTATATTTPEASATAQAPGTTSTGAPATTPAPDTTAPNTPKVTFPKADHWLSPDDPKIEITWSKVSDPSGVSYALEFSSWLGGGAGWTESKRTAQVKRLYYDRTVTGVKERFRIIAIDGVGNESAPSKYYFLIPAASASEAASLNAQQ